MVEMNPQEPSTKRSEAFEKVREAIQEYVRLAEREEGDGDNLIIIDFVFGAASIAPNGGPKDATYTYEGSGLCHTNIGIAQLLLDWCKPEYDDESL